MGTIPAAAPDSTHGPSDDGACSAASDELLLVEWLSEYGIHRKVESRNRDIKDDRRQVHAPEREPNPGKPKRGAVESPTLCLPPLVDVVLVPRPDGGAR